ncbi:MAG TPA: ATP-binding protein, partial [Burkholderiales bacterium]|nr:ATP-binding protein [Burkholderiales bacterium]
LADADLQKNEFLAMLSHELRNPLAPLRNALSLLKRGSVADADRDGLHDMMERQLQQLVRLVDDLLDVSRIIRGKIDLRREALDLRRTVHHAVETAQPVMEANGQAVNVSIPRAPLLIWGDPVRLAQAISNLLTNAAKYSHSSTPIELVLRSENGHAVVSVKDRGIGISPHLLPRIFDLFVQGEHTLARTQGGLGIGLTLVRRIVELHQGSVSAANVPGGGSEFILRFPEHAEQPVAEQHHALRPSRQAGLARRVLVVDDNVDAADSIAMLLRLFGHHVRCEYDGRSALDAVRQYRPDTILLDIGLPEVDGYEVARQIRKMDDLRRTRIVAVTGYAQEEDRKRSQAAGFDHHLTKPVDPEALQSILQACVS